VSNATQKKRTWAGYACPVCRFVFRVPKNHDGKGVICPACSHLLNLPKQKKTSPLEQSTLSRKPKVPNRHTEQEKKNIPSRVLSSEDLLKKYEAKSDESTSNTPQTPLKRRRVRRKKSPETQPSWENQPTSSSDGGNLMVWIVGGGMIGLIALGVGIWLMSGDVQPESSRSFPLVGSKINNQTEKSKLTLTEEEKLKEQEILDAVDMSADVLVESEKVVRAFLNAEKASDLESLVRTPDVTIPRMREWYARHEWTPPGVKDVGVGGGMSIKGKMASIGVRLNDFTRSLIALERSPRGYLVDWESWVAWCEMDWADLFKKRPTQLVKVRAVASLDSYYNREFRDDTKWLAVRLVYPKADRSIYGYIDKQSSILTSLIGDLRGGRSVPVTLKIRYLENSVADNQVVIEEYVQNGWVRPVAKSSGKKNPPHSQ
jgi:uncharacterized Zn finger protein (UPF0148 family)